MTKTFDPTESASERADFLIKKCDEIIKICDGMTTSEAIGILETVKLVIFQKKEEFTGRSDDIKEMKNMLEKLEKMKRGN